MVQLPANVALLVNDGPRVFLNRRAFFHLQIKPFGLQLGITNAQAVGGFDIDVGKMETAQRRFRGADNVGCRFAGTSRS